MTEELAMRCPLRDEVFASDGASAVESGIKVLKHLMDHATQQAIGMRVGELGDMSFAVYYEDADCPQSWPEIAAVAAELVMDEMADLFDIRGDVCASAVYDWLREQYPTTVLTACVVASA